MMAKLTVRAPAKINLGLHVLGKRQDGYHDIETCMVAIEWYDELTFETSDSFSFTCSDTALPTDDANLVVKAVNLLRGKTGHNDAISIHLDKNIPYAAGLGGGSSDAATTLKALRNLWELDLSDEELRELGAQIGSDVPFFISAEPAIATGRGEVLTPIRSDALPVAAQVLVVVAGSGISTAEAYGAITPSSREHAIAEVVTKVKMSEWNDTLVNDFEEVAFRLRPELVKIHDYIAIVGADYISLSGSGSAIYGLFEDIEQAERAAFKLRGYGLTAWSGKMIIDA